MSKKMNEKDNNKKFSGETELTQEEQENPEEKTIPIVDEEENNKSEIEDEEKEDGEDILMDLVRDRDNYKEKFTRTVAEMENLRKRTMKEKQDMIDYANERLLFRMLELQDDMDNAIEAGKNADDYKALLQGVEMIRQKSVKLFEDFGVKKMEDPVGEEFDVEYHEAMMAAESDQPEGTVIQLVQAGYIIKDKVLRHAKVITSSGQSKNKPDK